MPVEVKHLLDALAGTVGDVLRRRRDPVFHETLRSSLRVLPRAVKDTLPYLLSTREGHDQSLLLSVERHAREAPDALAVEMEDERLSWSALSRRTSRIAHVLSELGVRRGDVVVLMGENSPSYLALVLGISRLGAVASLVNHHLTGAPLAHAVSASRARVAVVEQRFASRLSESAELSHVLTFDSGELEERMARAPSDPFPRVQVDASDDFVYIFTSGTTGLPKPCRVSHARSVLAGAAFGPLLFEFSPGDKLYCVLPLYHSSALLIGAGGCIMSRTPLALRASFSARAFWPDVRKYGATAILYIGELCRYLVNLPPDPKDRDNPVRVAVGNGLSVAVWEEFQRRFDVPQIREFYSATEAPGAIFNLTGRVGSIGHVPARRFGPLKLARYDVDRDELVRGPDGYCIECGPGEEGELLIRLKDEPRSALGDFRGYTDAAATRKKVLTDVFTRGDKYFRSGDLMRFDDNDYFYFVDRIGDTFRWKGENVSTAEVAEVVARAPGVKGATVAGVHVPGAEGQAGLAALTVEGEFSPGSFWRTVQELPTYAQPRFVRIVQELSTTGTFKLQKSSLRSEGVNPRVVNDPLYLRTDDAYVPLTAELWRELCEGRVRL